ncbi:MAG: hypothetical protein EB058_14970 [Proteobacteria bacterium]|nr:hypothetical protein [Pseudomonadota bacterium]
MTIRATFTEADQLDTAPTITFTQDGNVTVPPPQPMSATSDRNVWTYAYTIPNVQNGTVSSTVAATDRAGNASTTASAPAFTIVNDLVPPKIVSIVRANGAAQLTTGTPAWPIWAGVRRVPPPASRPTHPTMWRLPSA